MADPAVRRRRGRHRPRRLRGRHPLRAARALGGHRRGRSAGRRLPQLGLHPDQGAPPQRGGRRPLQPGEGVRHHRRRVEGRLRAGGAALAQGRRPHGQGRRVPLPQEQDHPLPRPRARSRRPTWWRSRARTARTTLEAKRAVILATGSEPKSLPGVTIDEKRIVSSTGAVTERGPARLTDRHRRGRGGHRVRRRLRGLRHGGDGAGGAAARAAHRGRGGVRADRAALLPARDHDPHRREGQERDAEPAPASRWRWRPRARPRRSRPTRC